MKNILIVMLLLTPGIMGLVSCNKCSTCVKENEERKVCRSDFDTQKNYEAAVASYERQDYECNE